MLAEHWTLTSLNCINLRVSHICNDRRLLSKGNAGMSRATGDRQFLFLNGRPVDLPKVSSRHTNQTLTGIP